jgi:hypothetical protein
MLGAISSRLAAGPAPLSGAMLASSMRHGLEPLRIYRPVVPASPVDKNFGRDFPSAKNQLPEAGKCGILNLASV